MTVAELKTATIKYVSEVIRMPRIVPLGMAFWASLKSPEIFAPALNPVADGKYTANTVMNDSLRNCGTKFSRNNLPKPQNKIFYTIMNKKLISKKFMNKKLISKNSKF